MTARPRATAACLLVAAALAGCGGSKAGAPIPRAAADDLAGRLTEARNRSNPLRCHDLQKDTIPTLEQDARNLPQSVDQKVRTTVSDGVAHLRDLVQQQCDAQRQQRLQQQQQQTTSTATPPPTPPPTTQTTAPAPSTQTTPPPTATTPPPTTRSTPTQSTPTTNGGGISPPGNGPDGNGPPGQRGAVP
ncbi:MAG: hypothetical protein NVSMB25_09100 [Thermoleophilaceae bacterium]